MKKITLNYPINVNNNKVYILKMRRPLVRDMLAAEKMAGSDAQKEIQMLANLCEVEPDLVQAMDMADYMRLQEMYQDFLLSRPETSDAQ